jgi:hypothetical protein
LYEEAVYLSNIFIGLRERALCSLFDVMFDENENVKRKYNYLEGEGIENLTQTK